MQHTDSVEAIVKGFEAVYLEAMRKHYGRERFDGDLQLARNDMQDWLRTTLQAHTSQQVEEAVRKEREVWLQRLPEDTFSVTIEGHFGKRTVANRKFVSMKSIAASEGKTLLLEAEACAHQMLQAIVTPNHQD